MKEVDIMLRLDHPGVVSCVPTPPGLDQGDTDLPTLCMEFCEAGDLFTLITKQRGKPLQEELILFFFLQVVSNPSRGLS